MNDAPAGPAAGGPVPEEEYGSRRLTGPARWAVALTAAAWSLFQLSLPYLVLLSADTVRVIHLVFAITLVFLTRPALKKERSWLPGFLSARARLPLFDIILALVAAGAAAYYALDYEGIAARQGVWLTRDLVAGVVLVLLLLESARRSLGPALTVVASLFIIYAFVAPFLPAKVAFKGVSLGRLLSQLTLSQEGVYGVPLGVSAQVVFLFVLLGALLEKSGGGRWFVQLAFALLGRFKGGPAKAAVFSSGLTGMVSGSSIANVVTTGTFTIPLMKDAGYPPERAAAVEVAASTNGQLMPPIMGAAAFIIAENCNLPYLAVVRAAFVPAVVSYLALFYITHLEAGKLGLRPIPREKRPRFWPVFLSGAHFLVPLSVLVWLLVSGNSAAKSAFFAILTLAGLLLVRDPLLTWRAGQGPLAGIREAFATLGQGLTAGGLGMLGVGVACATAGIIVGVVNLGPGNLMVSLVEELAGGHILPILLLTALASLILGMGLPTTANYIVMATLTAPIIVELAGGAGFVVPLIAAHLFVFFFGILADDTPPVGLAAYAAAAIAKAKPIPTGVQGFIYDIRTAILPFMFLFNTDLLLWNITGWWHVGIIFFAAMLGMFAFAALTQGWLYRRNRWFEMGLLALAVLILLRPQLPGVLLERHLGLGVAPLDSKFFWYAAGAALFGLVYLLQRLYPGAPRPEER